MTKRFFAAAGTVVCPAHHLQCYAPCLVLVLDQDGPLNCRLAFDMCLRRPPPVTG